MASTKFVGEYNGEKFDRTSATRTYSHAIIAVRDGEMSGPFRWVGRPDLVPSALKACKKFGKDGWELYAIPVTPESKTRTRKPGDPRPSYCACGCGFQTGARYLPGHDARHASAVARAVVAGAMDLKLGMDQLITPALQAKAQRQISRLTA